MQRKRRTGKALLTFLLTFVLTFSMFATPVSAKQGTFYSLLAAAEQSYFRNLDSSAALKAGSNNQATLASVAAQIATQSLWNVVNAFRADNLEIFWSRATGIQGQYSGGMYNYTATFHKEVDWDAGGSRSSRLESDVVLVDSKVKALAAEARQKSTVYEQLAFVHDWLINNNQYNTQAASTYGYSQNVSAIPWTPLSALGDVANPVCEGYSRSFKLVCDELGIPCITVTGDAGERHMWNQVMINGKWYAVDVTFDDPRVSGINRDKSGYENRKYFLVGSNTKTDNGKTFAQDHTRDDVLEDTTLAYPNIEATAFDPNGSSSGGSGFIKTKSIKINRTSATMSLHEQLQLSVTFTPANASIQVINWTSSNPGVVTVDANGVVTCVGAGNAKITGTTTDGSNKKVTCSIKGPKAASSVKITGPKEIAYHGTAQLYATVKPDNAVDKTVTWMIERGAGTVDPITGLVTCTGSGDIKVRATTTNGKKATYTLKGPKAPSSVKITGEKSISLGQTITLSATVKPDNAIDKAVTWEVEKGNGTINATTGELTCTGSGDIKVRAVTSNGKKGTYTVKGPKAPASVKITGDKSISLNQTITLSAIVKPDNAIDKTVTWSVDKGNGTINATTGELTCTGAGDIKVRATTPNNKKATYTVKGPKAPASVKVTGEKSIELNQTITLTATVKPDNAIDKEVTWSVDKGNGTINPNTGELTCIGAGDIKVRAQTSNGKKGTFTVKGPKAAASVKVTGEKNIELNGKVQLTATVKPDNAIDKSVTWEVLKGNGTVDAKGLVTCTGAGDIKVQATTVTNKKGTFTIKGPKAASSVSVTKSSYKLAVGETAQPTATVKPANAIDLTVTWASSDPTIATVTPDGVITAVAPGKATITATAHNGKVGKCTITVSE